MSNPSGPDFDPKGGGASPPPHPFDQSWYVQGDGKALGPLSGDAIRDLIAKGSVRRATLVAKVGATQWVELGQEPALARLLGGAPGSTPAGRTVAAQGVVYAGFWIRLLAYIIDYVIIVVTAVVAGAIVAFFALGAVIEDDAWIQGFEIIGISLVSVFYFVYFPSGRWQATPGKRICGIHIVRTNGERVTGWLAFGRSLAYIISSIPLYFGFFMIGWTDQKKGLHDIICGTRVVYGKLGTDPGVAG
jgi:uncharacterized RDD family membrane protein YckC